MAEALLRQMAGDRFDVCSAGLRPTEVHPLTRHVLKEVDVDPSGLRAEGVELYLAKVKIKYAVVVCEVTQAECPHIYPFALETLYWPFEDPVAFSGSPDEKLKKFREVRDQIASRLRAWIVELTEQA
jgi:arsenate reductase